MELNYYFRDRSTFLEQWTYLTTEIWDLDTEQCTAFELFSSQESEKQKSLLERRVASEALLKAWATAVFGPFFAVPPLKALELALMCAGTHEIVPETVFATALSIGRQQGLRGGLLTRKGAEAAATVVMPTEDFGPLFDLNMQERNIF